MEADGKSNATFLLEARPPATDYLTYLTLIEYNLQTQDLPLLDKILQDSELTVNIGWDLVILLSPMLPESNGCLQTIARLGNPREVVLKVTEAVRLIDFDLEESLDEERSDYETQTTTAQKTTNEEDLRTKPLPVLQFTALLEMLGTLHARISTKFPSRFVSTSLQAVLATFHQAKSHHLELCSATVQLIRKLFEGARPSLPPRPSQPAPLQSGSTKASTIASEATRTSSSDDHALEKRLLQAFVTHVLEIFQLSLRPLGDLPALPLSPLLAEKLSPRRQVPGKAPIGSLFQTAERYQQDLEMIEALAKLAQDVGLHEDAIVAAASEHPLEGLDRGESEEDPPTSPTDVPLSEAGSLLLLARRVSDAVLGPGESASTIPIFPIQARILQKIMKSEELGDGTFADSAAYPIADAIVSLGLSALITDDLGDIDTPGDLVLQYLLGVSLISARTPLPTIRSSAHLLASTVLRSIPSSEMRLAFIVNTLEHCPYENLKTIAVGWLKAEVLEASLTEKAANPGPEQESERTEGNYQDGRLDSDKESAVNIFGTPASLQATAAFLFPDLTELTNAQNIEETWNRFQLNMSFYLATLNFYYLLLNPRFVKLYQIGSMHVEHDIGPSYIYPLKTASQRFRKVFEIGGEPTTSQALDSGGIILDLDLLDDILSRVERGVVALNV